MNVPRRLFVIGLLLAGAVTALPGQASEVTLALAPDGRIPGWLVAGPFEQPITGFGDVGSADMVGEADCQPVEGQTQSGSLTAGGSATWRTLAPDSAGFVDFNIALGLLPQGVNPEKVWYARAGYAVTYLDSPTDQAAFLLLGTNSLARVILNGQPVHEVRRLRTAQADEDTIVVQLRRGRNRLLVRVSNSHHNVMMEFLRGVPWGWGFFGRLTDANYSPLADVSVVLPVRTEPLSLDLIPTFYFKPGSSGLEQRLDVLVTYRDSALAAGSLEITLNGTTYRRDLSTIRFGENRFEIYVPEITAETTASGTVTVGDRIITKTFPLTPRKKYELHLMLLTHTDIGYTHPQPVVKELHVNVLDEVLDLCDQDPEFRWTIETVWQLEQYEQARPREKFDRLMAYVQSGRISVSPLYTNPYTGMVSTEELYRSLEPAQRYGERYGLRFPAAVYNDVPGMAWLLPQVLNQAGTQFLACGINEVYNDYVLQRALPKVFYWEGSDGSRLLTYLNQAYAEGRSYGLEKSTAAVAQRLWERLGKLEAAGYPYELVLLNAGFLDNGPVAKGHYQAAQEWNRRYAYPRFVISNLDRFAREFTERYGDDLPVLRGDWTSAWDILYQGEPARMIRQRRTQHQLLTAEKLAAVTYLLGSEDRSAAERIAAAYRSLLHFSGHGSGLEVGFGSQADNRLTMAYREDYVQTAWLASNEVLKRGSYRLAKPEESLEGEALMVFNPLSWERDAVISIDFPREDGRHFKVIDLASGAAVITRQQGHRLYFIGRDLPPMGYRKYRLISSAAEPVTTGELTLGKYSIENRFYRIDVDRRKGNIKSIVHKASGRNLVDESGSLPFFVPLVARGLTGHPLEPLPAKKVRVTLLDERPVRVVVTVSRKGHLFPYSEIILYDNLDRVDLVSDVDLERLTSTDLPEEYSLAFPFYLPGQTVAVEILGGFLNPAVERLPGAAHNGHSIRRSVGLSNNDLTIRWAAVDSRIVRLKQVAGRSDPVLIANLVNNFPQDWNRQEENIGILKFHFSFSAHTGGFDPVAAARLGWEVNTPPVVQRNWLRSQPGELSFLAIDNPRVVLLTMGPMENSDGLLLRLQNVHPADSAAATISSGYIEGFTVHKATEWGRPRLPIEVAGGSFTVRLGPNEIATLFLQP